MAWKNYDQTAGKRYLLRQLSPAEQQEVELRLLTEDSFADELEIAEDELIDQYVAHELSPDDRVRFEELFLTSPERHSKLRSAQVMKRHLDRLTPHRQPTSGMLAGLLIWFRYLTHSPIPVVVTAMFVVVVGLVVWRAGLFESDLQKGLVALDLAYRQERPVEARISGLSHAQFPDTRGNEPPRVDSLELDRAKRFLLDAATERTDAASYHAVGKLYLLQKEPNKAIHYLELAAQTDNRNAQIYADLGAAYFEKGKLELDASDSDNAGSGTEDLGRSLEYLKQALELNPNLLEALFNRGLVHQRQELYLEAEADWRAYLQKDSDSQWAVEANRNLQKLEQKNAPRSENVDNRLESFMRAYLAGDDNAAWDIYKRSHDTTGNSVTRALIDRLLDNSGGKTNENPRALQYLGQLEIRYAKDHYTSDLAKIYDSATPQTHALLKEARRQVVDGYALIRQSKIDEGTELLGRARLTFEKVGNVTELLATDSLIAHGAVVQPDLAKAQELLARTILACETKSYKWLLAQVLTDRAHAQSNLNNYSEAMSDSNRAFHLYQELQDVDSVLGTLVQSASLSLFLNDTETSLSFLKRAMQIAQKENAVPSDRWAIHMVASLNLSALKLYRAALDYQNEALKLALLTNEPLYISRSYQYLGLTYGSLQRFDLAIQNVRTAYEQGRPLARERSGRNMMALTSLKLGDLYRATGDQISALTAYDESLRLYEELDFAHYSYAAHKGKFLSYLAQNSDVLAAQELDIVLNLFNGYREKILNERQTSFFFDKEQDTCDLAVDFAYFRIGDKSRAFNYSEACRARNLRDLMHHGAEITSGATGPDLRSAEPTKVETSAPLTPPEIVAQLPEHVQIVQYAVLENKLVVWHLSRNGIFGEFVDIEYSVLKQAVTTALKQISERDENGTAASLQHLYRVLIKPIEKTLDSGKVICFVPDKILHFVPFSALLSESSGRYLVQDYRLMTSQSATIFIDATTKAAARSSLNEDRILAVGDPTFDRAANPDLGRLPAAEREAQEVAKCYPPPSRRVLVQREATRKRVMTDLSQAQVAHFATHYVIHPRSQLSSKLLLSSEPGQQAHHSGSDLTSGDIYGMKLTQTKLIILSACQTGIEQQFGGEGPIGFARSFLVAGVPVVVASLWPVDSDATAELMIKFHRFRKTEDRSTTDALMRAQKELLSQETYRHPYYWAGFTTIGGYSDF